MNPLISSVIFTAIEILIFIFIAHSSIDNNPNSQQYYTSLMGKLLPNFGNLIIAIATTWYVVFTYFILRTSEAVARKSSEPYVSLNWATTSQPQKEEFDYTQKIKSEIARYTGSAFYSSDIIDILPGRYINIEILNERSALLGVLNIRLEINFIPSSELQGINLKPISLNWKSDRAGIQIGDALSITVADLAHVPSIFSIEIKIKDLYYTSNDSDRLIRDYKGGKVTQYRGIAEIRAAMPSPSEVQELK